MAGSMTLSNLISAFRIAASPALILAGTLGDRDLFVILLGLFLLSDFLDGALARAFHKRTLLGARLDSWGDIAMYACASVGALLLWRDVIMREAVYLSAALGMLGFSGAACLIKHRQLPSYHTYSAKLSTAVIGISALLMFAGFSPWPFRLSLVLLALAAAEETAITFILPEWRPDIRTMRHATTVRREILRKS